MKIVVLSFAIIFFLIGPAYARNEMALKGLLYIGGCETDPCPLIPDIKVYEHPFGQSKIIGKIDVLNHETWPENEELDYEAAAVVVFDKTEDWYQIRIHDQMGWIRSEKGYNYSSYPELLKDRLSFIALPEVVLKQTPLEGGKTIRLPEDDKGGSGRSVEVLDIRHGVDKAVWIKANIMSDFPCSPGYDVPPPRILATGWIKAYKDNKPTVWFYSRGC